MKRLLIILAILPLLFTSCIREPYADFIANKRVVEVGETVYFTNRSIDARQYEWDFDDGYFPVILIHHMRGISRVLHCYSYGYRK
jgi:hypothetical protein